MPNSTMSDNSVFETRLKELRGKKNLDEVAKAIGISRVSLGYYEQGKRHPDAEVLTKLAVYYGVSLDYLVGISNVKSQSFEIQQICEIIGLSEEAIKALRHFKFMCNPDNVFDPGMKAKLVIEGDPDKKDITPFKRDEDTSIGRKKFASENEMILRTIDQIVRRRPILKILMSYLYFDKIREISVNDKIITPALGIVQVNGLMQIGGAAIKSALLSELKEALDAVIEDMKEDVDREQLIDLFLG